jgi:uncharacterized protein with HEPN domain
MSTDIKKFLEDILLSINAIEIHIQQVNNLQEYESNITVTDAVERRLAVIGEALYQINKKEKQLPISNKLKIIGLRHILIHNYDLIEDATIWNIIFRLLPVLKTEVSVILNNLT